MTGPAATTAIGIDLGGSNLRAALWDGLPGEPRLVREVSEPVGERRAPAEVADRLAAVIEALGGGAAVPAGIGVAAMLGGGGSGGAAADDRSLGLVAVSPHFGWRDVNLGSLLRARLGGRPFAVVNDVNAIAWGELQAGAGRGCSDLLVVCVGTGVGGAVVTGGRLAGGPTRCAGEIGHIRVAWGDDALPCACGARGCLETLAGGAYLAARAGGRHAGEIDAAAAAGDPGALAIVAEAARHLGRALAAAVTLLAPERLLLGGGVWRGAPTLRRLTLAALGADANPPALAALTIADVALGDAAGPLGAALLALDAR